MSSSSSSSVLICGAGMCTRPLVEYLSNKAVKVTVASRTLSRAEHMCSSLANAGAIELDASTDAGVALLGKIAGNFDALISMLPYLLHKVVARAAVAAGKHFLTTSYVQPGVAALGQEAADKGLVFINECGVDPGTDHMSAMRVIDAAAERGGKVRSFTSFCGGLPALDANDNPFGFKFAWAPRGVLLASRNPARYLRDGEVIDVAAGTLFERGQYDAVEVNAPGMEGVQFEAYPNRDSTKYVDLLRLHDCKTLKRGTYRFAGWCATVLALSKLGYLSLDERTFDGVDSYAALTHRLAKGNDDGESARDAVARALEFDAAASAEHRAILDRFEWLGLFNADLPLVASANTELDQLCAVMDDRMGYAADERDMLLMQHEFHIEYDDRVDVVTTTLVDYGIKGGDSSMSRTVSYPIGIATMLVLDGKFSKPGLSIPNIPELYNPILDELSADFNITFVENLVSSTKKQ
jgi:saccharopine dehydrogenase-like NADP-dependent oxidoreductase